MKFLSNLLMIVLVIAGCFLTACANEKNSANQTNATEAAQQAKLEEELKAKHLENNKKLQVELDAVMAGLSKNGTDYSVYVYLPKSDLEYQYSNKRMGSASMIKVFIMEYAYKQISEGKFTEETVLTIESDTRVGGAGSLQGYSIGTGIKMSTLLRKMIVESDNTATNMLIKYLGMDNINAYMQSRGYNESLLCRRMMDYESLRAGRDNVTSVRDLGLFFKRVYAGQAVNETLDAKMVSILKDQEDTNKIPKYLPSGVAVAHKTGEINAVMNDGGIVYAENPYILCILTDNAPGYNLAIEQVAVLTKKINDVVQNKQFAELYAPSAGTTVDNKGTEKQAVVNQAVVNQSVVNQATVQVEAPAIVDKPVITSDYKRQLMREYSKKHYGQEMESITPKVVIVHWTASNIMSSAYNWFNREEYGNEPGTLNVGSQFIVDRDGTIYRIMEETALGRHAIGYNHCAIGIENVGGENNVENLTAAQLDANIKLISYLAAKYPTIKYVWGHYQQDKAKASGLYIENISGYYSGKSDPGKKFMSELHKVLEPKGLTFFEE